MVGEKKLHFPLRKSTEVFESIPMAILWFVWIPNITFPPFRSPPPPTPFPHFLKTKFL
jgi:hypothetical protein